MKVVFIQPKVGFQGHTWEALGIGYLIAYLNAYYNRALDIEFYSGFYDSDELIVKSCEDADIIGFSCTSPQYKHALMLAEKIKRKDNVIVIGGAHPSALPDLVIKDNPVDVVVQGEGERSILKIIEDVSNGKKISKEIYYSDYIENIDSIPFPNRGAIKCERNINEAYKDNNLRITSILSSRGCPYSCGFCCSHCIWGRVPRLRSASNIFNEFDDLVNKWGIEFIKFADDTFTISKKRVIDFCKIKLEKGLQTPYGANAHINTMDEDVIKYLSESNCQELWYGVESGSPKILKEMQKNTKIDKIKEVFRLTKKYNIKTRAYFLLGMPNETIDDIRMTEKLCDELSPDIVGFSLLSPYPINDYFDYETMHAWNWSIFDEYNNDQVCTKTINNQELKREQKRLVDKYKKKITFRQKE